VIATGMAGAWNVVVGSDRALGTGLAAVAIRVTDPGGSPVTGAQVTFGASRPSTGAIAPVPVAPHPDGNGNHLLEVALAEVASAADGWVFRVGVSVPGGPAGAAIFPGLPVVERGLAGLVTQEGESIVLAVRFEKGIAVGLNPVHVSLHAIGSGATFAVPIADATLHVEPFMPSMGHGSQGSVDPVATSSPGLYAGSLSFSMAGEWESRFTVLRGGLQVGTVTIRVVF
jgi:hypothetical protein